MGPRSRGELAAAGRRAGVADRGPLRAAALGLVALALVAAVTLLIGGSPALADTTVNVNTTSDAPAAGQCSLREAINYANGGSQPGCAAAPASGTTVISLPSGTYALTGGALSVAANVTIIGQGPSSTTISGGNSSQVFNIAASVQVTLSQVTITGGLSGVPSTGCSGPPFFSCPMENGNNGGGIVNAGTLTLDRTIVTGNNASAGTLPSALILFFCSPNCPPRAGASAGNGGWGGGIDNSGTLTITNSTISNNSAGQGGDGTNATSGQGSNAGPGATGGTGGVGGSAGAIYNEGGGRLTISGSTISGNSAGRGGNAGGGSDATASGTGGNAGAAEPGGVGGAIVNFGTVSITRSTISGNQSGRGGNGANGGVGMSAANGSPSSSSSGGTGGAMYTSSSQAVTLVNDTLSVNAASPGGTGGSASGAGGSGGAIYQVGGGLVQLSFVTITHNTAAATVGGIDNAGGGALTEAASIVAANTGSPAENCSTGTVTDLGSNIVSGDNSCPGRNADPRLGALAANGGPTQTMALLPGSAAIDGVPANACPVTTDQRGVSRPQGPACDAGAYELAPPVIASIAGTGSSTSVATVTASINPNLSAQDTMVTVRYGTTSAYGSATQPQDIGAGGRPVSFSVNLAGLTPATTYHFDVVATNGDGASISGDGTFTTIPPTTPSLSNTSTTGPTLSLTLACNGGSSGSACAGPITVASHVTSQGKTVVAVSAAAKKKKPKPKSKKITRRVTVAQGAYSVASGKTTTVKLKLNAAGMKLLSQRYTLPATVAVGGTSSLTKTVTFRYGRLHISPSYTWAFAKTFSFATELTVNGLPKKSKVALLCHGHGCPFAKRTFSAPKNRKLALAPSLKQGHLSPHSTVQLQITAANTVGEVVIFTILSGKSPSEAFLCLPPGAHAPGACAKG
jgi:CSLREA domain-containing protein